MKKKINFSELDNLIENLSKNSQEENESVDNINEPSTREECSPPKANPYILFLIFILLLLTTGSLSKKKKK